MAAALRQSYIGATSGGNCNVTSVVAVLGDLIIAAWGGGQASNGTSTGSVADNAAGGSNTYSEAARITIAVPPASNSMALHCHYAVAKANDTLTVTATVPAAEVDTQLIVHVVSGCGTVLASVLSAVNTKADAAASTSHTSASVSPAGPGYAFVLWANSDTGPTLTENGTGFTKRQENAAHEEASFDQILSAGGTYNDAITSSISTILGSVIATFNEAGGAAAPVVCIPEMTLLGVC